MQLTRVMVLAVVTSLASGHAMPIWEMLTREEKMGQVLYAFVHLVDQSCAYSYIQDCHHVLTLHGLSNLVNMNEYALNRLDPYQPGARQVIWNRMMHGVWQMSPAYLPYYLAPQGDDITNEIDTSFPSSPQPSSPAFLYPYAPIPNTLNTPVAAVSDPHPYAVKVTPPPNFTPSTHASSDHPTSTPQSKVQEVDGKMKVGDSEVAPEDRFAGWSDSEAIVGNQEAMEEEFERWSDGDVVVGNQEPVEDIYASWSDAEMIVSNQHAQEDRYASWSDGVATAGNQKTSEDIYASWSDGEMIVENQEDRYANWNDAGEAADNQEPQEDRYTSWNDEVTTAVDQQTPEDIYTTWSDSSSTNTNRKTETDRYAAWRDSEAGLSDKEDIKVPAGIQPSANFEPVMVESRVVVSRVAPPPSMLAGHSIVEEKTRKRRSEGSRSLLPLPLPLLRQ